jgi:hypothetical protein
MHSALHSLDSLEVDHFRRTSDYVVLGVNF